MRSWPDTYFVDYAYDELNRLMGVTENGMTSLAGYDYDPLSRRALLTLGNGAPPCRSRTW